MSKFYQKLSIHSTMNTFHLMYEKYKKGIFVQIRDNKLKVVTSEYMENHFNIIHERIALGAIRLSKLLNKIFQEEN